MKYVLYMEGSGEGAPSGFFQGNGLDPDVARAGVWFEFDSVTLVGATEFDALTDAIRIRDKLTSEFPEDGVVSILAKLN